MARSRKCAIAPYLTNVIDLAAARAARRSMPAPEAEPDPYVVLVTMVDIYFHAMHAQIALLKSARSEGSL